MVDKVNSVSGDATLSGEACHVGSMESENVKMYRSHGSATVEFIAEHNIELLKFSKDTGEPI